VNSLIAQRVSAIVISANDPDALAPVLKRAMDRGIKVLSFDSGVRKDGRMMHLNPSSNPLIGEKLVKMTADAMGSTGEVAVLSATAQATNQNIWIEEAKKVLAQPAYKGLKLVSVVYGDDQTDKSYREAQGLFKTYPNLKAIIAPTTVGVAAAAKAVQDEKKVGSIYVTGLGLPSEMAGHVKSGAVKSFAIWNPIDLGYSSIMAASQFISGKVTGKAGDKVSLGRVGTVTLDANGEAAMSETFHVRCLQRGEVREVLLNTQAAVLRTFAIPLQGATQQPGLAGCCGVLGGECSTVCLVGGIVRGASLSGRCPFL